MTGIDGTQSHRPRGWLGHLAALGTPAAADAGRVALERDASLRLRRLAAATVDAAEQRARPDRPRMQALTLAPGGRLRWRRVPAPPPPPPDGALVRPIAVATCDMDRPLMLGRMPFPLPLQLGHECVAEVLSVGSRVSAVRPGDRVVVPFQISCGSCRACRAGRTGNCERVPPLSMYGFGVAGGHWGGVLAEQVAVPYADAMLVRVPDGLDPAAVASVADTASDAYRHIAPHLPLLAERGLPLRVLIVGAVDAHSPFSASVALFAGQIALALGAEQVLLADARPRVRDHARRLGLHPVEPRQLSRLRPAPLVVDASASRRGLVAALRATAPDGVCSCAGLVHRTAPVPGTLMFGRNVTLHLGRSHVRAAVPEVLELVAGRRLHPEAVITRIGELSDAVAVLTEHLLGESTKTVLVAAGAAGRRR